MTVTLKEMRSSLSDFLPWGDSHQLRKRREGREIEFQLERTRIALLSENVTLEMVNDVNIGPEMNGDRSSKSMNAVKEEEGREID